ncbi:MAG TPA: TonB family protein [Terriglobales bacterium]|nr:TonB family protein [Terriglobales bacterium]
MFTPLGAGQLWERVSARAISLLLHAVLIGWLLQSPAPKFLTPSFLVKGENGKYVAHLYWLGKISENAPDASAGAASQAEARMVRKPITWNRSSAAKSAARRLDRANDGTDSKAGGSRVRPLLAGSPFGSVSEGMLTGPDVRPALPVVSIDPRIELSDLPEGMREGDEIIEITIDAQGTIVQKIVISSLSPTVDAKVLAALENWHFLPATRFGVPIPSKQDVHYHFPQSPRG